MHKKYDLDKLLANPEKAPVPEAEQIDVMWALVGSIAEKAKSAPGTKMLVQALKYMCRMPREFSFIGVQNLTRYTGIQRYQSLTKTPEYQDWFKNNLELLNEARQANFA
jgi:hypothetical protein